MIKINKYQKHINTLEIGSRLIFDQISEHEKTNDSGSFRNDQFNGKYITNGQEMEATIWMRHFLDECEIENNISMTSWTRSLEDDEGMIQFPNAVEIIGFNADSKKVVIRPLDNDKK